MLIWDVWARHSAEGDFSRLFNPVFVFDNKTCTWKRGDGRHWYVQKKPHHGGVTERSYGITWKHVYFNISFPFIAGTTSVLKLEFPTAYVIFLLFRPLFLSLLSSLSSLLLFLLLVLSLPFLVIAVIVVVNIMLMFSILVLLCVPYFIVYSVNQ